MIESITSKRAPDWAATIDNMFLCPNGHLQYNLSSDELAELIARGETPPDQTYEGAKCRSCDARVQHLTSDVKELQYKLSTYMMVATSLRVSLKPMKANVDDNNEIALFLRNNYAYEIASGFEWHNAGCAKAVIHYLKIERKRPSVVMGRIWRALLRLIGE
jgi:hypothetical protein